MTALGSGVEWAIRVRVCGPAWNAVDVVCGAWVQDDVCSWMPDDPAVTEAESVVSDVVAEITA